MLRIIETPLARLACILAAGALLLGLAGCRLFAPPQSSDCSVRLIDAIPGAESIRVAVDGKKVFNNCRYRAGTSFQGIPAGRYDVYAAVEQADGDGLHLPLASIDAEQEHRYTALALGLTVGAPRARLMIFDDPVRRQSPIPRNQALVRVVSAVPDAGSVDVLVNGIVAFKNLQFGDRSERLPLAALPYEWSVKEAGGYVTPLAGPVTLNLRGGRSYLIVLMGRASDQTLSIQEFEDR